MLQLLGLLPFIVLQAVPVWTLTEELRIGELDGPGALTAVGAVITNADESVVYVSQPREQVIRFFDAASGALLGTIGRSGEGPGEFRSITRLSFRSDTLFASDLFQLRYSAFSATGETHLTRKVVSRPAPGIERSVSPVVPAGEGIVWGESMIPVASIAVGRTKTLPVVLMDESGEVVATVVRHDMEGAAKSVVAGNRVSVFLQPMADLRSLHNYAPDGSAIVVAEVAGRASGRGSFVVTKVTSHRDTIFHKVYSYPIRRLPEEVRDSIYRFYAGTFGVEPFARSLRLAQEHVDVPDAAPPIAAVVADTRGGTWLLRHMPPEGRANLLVLDRAGGLAAMASLPEGVELMHVSDRYVWGVEYDRLGVPYLVKYRVHRSD